MNMAIRGIDANFGEHHEDTFFHDLQAGPLRCDHCHVYCRKPEENACRGILTLILDKSIFLSVISTILVTVGIDLWVRTCIRDGAHQPSC